MKKKKRAAISETTPLLGRNGLIAQTRSYVTRERKKIKKGKSKRTKKVYRTNKDTIALNVEHFPPHFAPQPEEFNLLSYGSKEIELEALKGYGQGLRKILRGAKKCKRGKMKKKNKGKVGMRRKPNLTTILLNAQSPCSEGCEVVLNPGKFRKAYDTDDLDTSSPCYKLCPGWIKPPLGVKPREKRGKR